MPNYTYDPNTDYQALIDQAVQQGNYYMAAIYEQQRNAKISGENMQGVSATNQYSNYLPTTEQKSGYVNPYQQQLDATIGKVTGNFSYNPDTDPIASAYKKTYLREADRTMQDTLGQYSTMTGGIPSAQAVAAASQTADNYKAQLSAQLAQLGEQAYSREVNKVGLLMSAAQNADSQYYNSISAAMSRWAQLGAADAQVAQVLGVPVGTQTSDAQYQQWQMKMTEQEYEDNKYYQSISAAMSRWAQLGVADEQVAQVLGVPVGTPTSDESYRQWQQSMAEQEYEDNKYYQSISAAMSRWAMLGVADEEVSRVLGVPVGTLTSDAQYQQWQQAMTEEQYADSQHSNALSEAMTLLSAGIMPSEALLSAAGITSEQAKQIIAAATSKSSGSSGGSYSSSGSKGKPVTDQKKIDAAIAAYQSGNHVLFEQIIEQLRYQGYDAEGLALYIYTYFPYTPPQGYTGATGPAPGKEGQSKTEPGKYVAP